MGRSSGLGAVRSKNSSIASAGTLWPIVEWGLRRLQRASMNSIAACLAESLVGKLRLWCISFSSVAKNPSATALSWQLPLSPARLDREVRALRDNQVDVEEGLVDRTVHGGTGRMHQLAQREALKVSLGGMSPAQYRMSMGLAA